ncbi:MAG: elongation factor Ts [Bacilli bacterium]|nr:elongation factor Ts [Bacilli bacterium]
MDASLIKKLKDMTNAGLMDCKKALEASNENIDEAVKWLREKGISKAAKKADRIAAEGSSMVLVDGNNAVIVELNCETDFVSANEKFRSLLERISKAIINSDAKTVEEALALPCEEGTVNDDIINVTATMGEKISLRRFTKITKNDNEVFGSYIHMGGKISALCLVEGTDETVASDVAMHLAAMNPKYVSRDLVPSAEIEEESKVLREQAINEGKPVEIAEKMVQGRINKYYKDIVITEQEFVKNPDMTVGAFLSSNNSTLKDMVRYEVGEGIEKKEENFAEEVAKQING